ncbi:sugar phosphate isomerase/epimerase family protein [Streptomyces kutzneri]|uniref:sugar phosphate isomerase/epimerase family protein n=1 Tax=Streptomyces kutzneri TaxID=3051179 RepID=UPI0028D50D6B|nr:sugar phosphate isomerase/epimerase family protein [Streptomyces sp. DSM 40907]
MKYAFSTLGLPGTALGRSAALAAAHGFDGLELRAHPEEPLHPASPAAERTAALRALAASGVAVLGVAGYARVAAPGPDGPVLAELRALVRLAADLEAPYARVFPGGGLPEEAADARAVRRLAAAAPYAQRHGVRILLETHDSHRTGAAAARVLDKVAHPGAGALWDVLHTWLGGESPAASHRALAPYLGYVQVKDVRSALDLTPVTLGAGTLPLAGAVAALPGDGWLCWEYEKRWYPAAPDLPGLLSRGRAHLHRLAAHRRRETA